jgi:hypothetical protein
VQAQAEPTAEEAAEQAEME